MKSKICKQVYCQQTQQRRSIKKWLTVAVLGVLLSLLIWSAYAIGCSTFNDERAASAPSEEIVKENLDNTDKNDAECINDMIIDNEALETDLAEYHQDFYVGKVYSGGGNGGGLGTSLTIRFGNNGECMCESDWYNAFNKPIVINGSYSVKDKCLIVKCHVDESSEIEVGYDVEFKFDISDKGKTLSFNHSAPNEAGSIGNDYMTLTEE